MALTIPAAISSSTNWKIIPSQPFAARKSMVTGRYSVWLVMVEKYEACPIGTTMSGTSVNGEIRPLLKPYGGLGELIMLDSFLCYEPNRKIATWITYSKYTFRGLTLSASPPTYSSKLSEQVTESLRSTFSPNQSMKMVLLLMASVKADAG